jgi:hypothetical protein
LAGSALTEWRKMMLWPNVLGFSVMKVSALRDEPLEVAL